MLGRAIHHASTVPVDTETDVIALGDRNTLIPEETTYVLPEEAPAPVVVPQIQRPAADAATLSLGDAVDSQYAVLITADTSAIIALQRASNAPLELVKRNLYQAIEDLGQIYLDMMHWEKL